MSQDVLRYDLMVQDALKGVVRKILTEAARDGLPGEHHFYVTFRTTAPGVRLSQRLREKHPEEMTVVLQHQFWDLNVSEHSFEVGLSFSGVPERLLVPFDSITTFFDPSVQFGLKFETQEAEDAGAAFEPEPELSGQSDSVPTKLAPAKLAPAKVLPAKIVPAGVPALKKADAEKPKAAKPETTAPDDVQENDDHGGAEVVSLDSFRKKT